MIRILTKHELTDLDNMPGDHQVVVGIDPNVFFFVIAVGPVAISIAVFSGSIRRGPGSPGRPRNNITYRYLCSLTLNTCLNCGF